MCEGCSARKSQKRRPRDEVMRSQKSWRTEKKGVPTSQAQAIGAAAIQPETIRCLTYPNPCGLVSDIGEKAFEASTSNIEKS